MLGAVIVVIVMVLLGPVALFAGGALWSAAVGGALTAEANRPASEPQA